MVCCNSVLSHNNWTTLSHLSRKQHKVHTSAFNTFNIFKRLLFTTSRNAWTCTNGYDPWRHDGIAVAPTPPDSPTPTFHPCSLFQINKTQRGRLVLCNTHKSRTHVFLSIMKYWLNYSRSLVAPRLVGSELKSDCGISDLNPGITELLAASCRTWHRPRWAQWLHWKSAAWPKAATSQDAAQRRPREKSMPNIRSSRTSCPLCALRISHNSIFERWWSSCLMKASHVQNLDLSGVLAGQLACHLHFAHVFEKYNKFAARKRVFCTRVREIQ